MKPMGCPAVWEWFRKINSSAYVFRTCMCFCTQLPIASFPYVCDTGCLSHKRLDQKMFPSPFQPGLFYEDELLLVQCPWCSFIMRSSIPGLAVWWAEARFTLLCPWGGKSNPLLVNSWRLLPRDLAGENKEHIVSSSGLIMSLTSFSCSLSTKESVILGL